MSENEAQARPTRLLLGFERDQAPDIDEVQSLLLGHPRIGVGRPLTEDGNGAVLQLLLGALTFDLLWAPDSSDDESQTSLSLNLSPYLSGGEAMMPIVRGWMECGRILCSAINGVGSLLWTPSGRPIPTRLFISGVDGWLENGRWPVAVLVGFGPSRDGGLLSQGLAHFTGQELWIDTGIAAADPQLERVAGVIASHLALMGTLTETQTLTGPDGTELRIEPIEHGSLVHAYRG